MTLKTAAGQTIVAPVDKFITADQQHIAEWRKANPAKINYRFTADYTKSRIDSSKTKQGSETFTTETWECNIKLANQTPQTLEGVTVDYIIYYDNIEQGNKVTRNLMGKAEVGTMKSLQQVVLKTQPVKLQGVELEGGFYYTNGARSRQKESVTGMTVNVNHDGKKVFSWSGGNVPKGGPTAEGTSTSLSAGGQ